MSTASWNVAICVLVAASATLPAACRATAKGDLMLRWGAYGETPDGRVAYIHTLANAGGMRVTLTDWGATMVGVEVPDRAGKRTDVTLGYETLEGWLENTSYFGATVGRYGNRIARGKFAIDGRPYTLATNNGENHLHGGVRGFDKRLWEPELVTEEDAIGIKFTYRSPDGEEGYPGNLLVTVTYRLRKQNRLEVDFQATTDRPTVVNLVHHSYWNLGGPEAGDIRGHELTIDADQYTPVDDGLIPTGELAPVEGTPMDFRAPLAIGARIDEVKGGYDHNFVLRGKKGELRRVARVVEPESGRVMEIFSDQPGIQFYSGNFLDGTVTGKGGVAYGRHHGFCLETQHFPDSPNQDHFPSVILRPGETYRHRMVHEFSTE